MCVGNNMLDLLPTSLRTNGTMIRIDWQLIVQQKEEKIICKKHLCDDFSNEDPDGLLNNVGITLIDKVDPSALKEERNFGGLSCIH